MFEESVSSIPSIWASMNSWFTPAVFFVLLNVMIGTIAFTSTLSNKKHQQNQDSPNDLQPQSQPKLATSSSVLQRLKSINFSTFRSQEPHFRLDSETHFSFEATQNILSDHNPEKQEQHLFEQNPSEKAKGNEEEYSFVYPETHLQKSPQEGKIEENAVWQSEDVGTGEEIQSLDEVYSKLNGRHQVIRSKSDTKPVAGEFPKKLPVKMKKSATMKSPFNHFEMEDIVEARRPATVKEKSSKAADVVDEEVDAKADDFINKFKQQLQLQRLDSIIRYKEMVGRGSTGTR